MNENFRREHALRAPQRLVAPEVLVVDVDLELHLRRPRRRQRVRRAII